MGDIAAERLMGARTAWVAAGGSLLIAIATIVAAVKFVLHLPGIPYNVRELFLDDASLPALTYFAITILWIGAGARLIAELTRRSRRPALLLPVLLILVSLVSKILISRAVTYESLDDVLGTDNFYGLVTAQHVWGDWWRARAIAVGPDVVDFLERRVRYTALYSLPSLATALAFMTLAPLGGARMPRTRDNAAIIGVSAAWTWLCGSIVITWAATDNLTELIAPSGPLGVPGPLWLLLLLIVFAAIAALLTSAIRSRAGAATAIVATIVGAPLSWWLLNAGLEQHVQKYGVTFPATQFLLGPDRQHTLTLTILFARWVAVYVAGVASVATGGWIAGAFVEAARATSARRPTAAAGS